MTVTVEERRRLAFADAHVELRAEAGRERFVGLASPFGVRTAIGNPRTWGFFEEIAPGAYTKTLQEGDQRMLIDHDSYYVVSRVSAGTLKLFQSKRGLEVESELDDNLSYVRDLKANIRNGNITGMSIGFYVVKEAWSTIEVEDTDENGKTRMFVADLRTILESKLVEVSAVTFPAYEDTSAELAHVAAALVRRGDAQAIEKRVAYRPELRNLLGDRKVFAVPELRKAIPSHSTDTSDAAWDGPANEARLDNDAGASTYRRAYAWVDPAKDADTKSAYKFIHHFVDEDGTVGAASTRACINGIAVLNGARGGTTIPDADRQGVYDHLARHLRDAGLEPPELKSIGDVDVQVTAREPGETTHADDETEPARTTRHLDWVDRVMRAYAARYRLPL